MPWWRAPSSDKELTMPDENGASTLVLRQGIAPRFGDEALPHRLIERGR